MEATGRPALRKKNWSPDYSSCYSDFCLACRGTSERVEAFDSPIRKHSSVPLLMIAVSYLLGSTLRIDKHGDDKLEGRECAVISVPQLTLSIPPTEIEN